MLKRIVLVALFVGLLVVGWRFAGANADPVGVDYLLGVFAPRALWQVLMGAGFAGALGAVLVLGPIVIRSSLESRRYRKAMLNLEAEVHQLRNLPVTGDEQDAAPKDGLAVSGGGAGRSL